MRARKLVNKLQYISDIHLEYKRRIPRLPIVGQYLALCGDIGSPLDSKYKNFLHICSNNYEKVFLIAGNHEYWNNKGITVDEMNQIIRDVVRDFKNVHFLDKNCAKLGDISILGTTLWSRAISERSINVIHRSIRSGHGPMNGLDINRMHDIDTQWLENELGEQEKSIVLTHYLPTYDLIVPKYKHGKYALDRYATNLDHLIKKPTIAWLCGHSHCVYEREINGVMCAINAVNRGSVLGKYIKLHD